MSHTKPRLQAGKRSHRDSPTLPIDLGEHELVGAAEVAELAGVTRAAVGNWRLRGTPGFPLPSRETKSGPLYRRAEVVQWLRSRGLEAPAEPLGIEAELWSVSDRLRGGIDSSRYRHVVLGLVFLRHLTTDRARSSGLRAPAGAGWSSLLEPKSTKPLGARIDALFRALEEANPEFHGVLPKGYADLEIDERRLRGLLEALDRLPVSRGEAPRDVLGRIYEYFLSRFAALEGRSGGEFFTPTCVVRLLVDLVEPIHGSVYDPCCGSGGMFVQSQRFIEAHGGRPSDVTLFGQESNPATWRLAQLNLALHGLGVDLGPRPADTLHDDLHPDREADYVLANPPFNMSDWGAAELSRDRRWAFGVPPPGNANFAWIQHIVAHLGRKGRAGVVLANGSLSSDQAAEQEIRRGLLEADLIDCMVALPPQLFYSTSIPATLWLLRRKRNRPIDRRGAVLMIDAHAKGRKVTRAHRVLTDPEIAAIADCYRRFKGEADPAYRDEPGFCRSVDLPELRRSEYALMPSRYVEQHHVTVDTAEDFRQASRELRDTLLELRESDQAILEALAEIGDG
jgi:type I restriction enzyme M protein